MLGVSEGEQQERRGAEWDQEHCVGVVSSEVGGREKRAKGINERRNECREMGGFEERTDMKQMDIGGR